MDITWMAELLTVPNAAAVFITAFLALITKKMYPTFSKFKNLIDDIGGEDARPGVAARPGLMERMAGVETSQTTQHETLARLEIEQRAQGSKLEIVRHEVEFNNGSSVKDAAVRTEKDVAAVKEEVLEIKDVVSELKLYIYPNATAIASQQMTVEVYPSKGDK